MEQEKERHPIEQPYLYNKVQEYKSKVVQGDVFFEQFHVGQEDAPVVLIPDLRDALIFEIDADSIAGQYYGIHDEPRKLVFRAGVTYFNVNVGPGKGFESKKLFVNQVVPLHALDEAFAVFDFDDFRAADFERRTCQVIDFIEKNIRMTDCDHILRVLDYYVSEGYGVTLDEAARHCGYSSRQMRNIFRAQIGISPKQAVQIMRFQHALREMAHGETKMKDLAQQFLFYDEAHFDKYFKKYAFDVSPSRFAKSIGRMD
ncbi:MAG: helix-turn-helix transcriptional regulator [Clostridiales Family XIII bacterium]|jgi:AraC-like DNA-binding protein|nr:helix-turn-helix transcriptional regulator [Clostridiales Family XIII bacterium]